MNKGRKANANHGMYSCFHPVLVPVPSV